MADDPFDAILDDIRVELGRLDPDQEWDTKDSRWAVGKVRRDYSGSPPRVAWIERRGTIEPPDIVGGNTGTIAADSQEFEVTIWHISKGDCRATLHNLMVAIRNTVFGPNHTIGPTYEWVEDANMNKGRALT